MEQVAVIARELVVSQLRNEILAMQGFRKASDEDAIDTGLGPIEAAFPNKTFPTGAIHEFTSKAFSHVAATNGFITGIAGSLMKKGGACLWVSTKRTVFPASLQFFGIEPERIIFIDERQTKQALWAIEEGLKCASLAAE
jgi:protein ImuA